MATKVDQAAAYRWREFGKEILIHDVHSSFNSFYVYLAAVIVSLRPQADWCDSLFPAD